MIKRFLRIAIAVFLFFALFLLYQVGFIHRVAFKAATAAGIEWGASAPQVISVYFPRWACGEGMPPYLLVETDDAATVGETGKHIRISNDEILDFGEHFFAECRGRFKNSLAMLIWEHEVMRLEGWGPDELPLTGRFFEADRCEAGEPSLEQSLKIDAQMKPYREPE